MDRDEKSVAASAGYLNDSFNDGQGNFLQNDPTGYIAEVIKDGQGNFVQSDPTGYVAEVIKDGHGNFMQGVDIATPSAPVATPIATSDRDGSTLNDEVTFVSGLNSNGTLAGSAYATWHRDNPATYETTSRQFKWGGTTAGTPGGTLSYYFDPASNWTDQEKTSLVSGLNMWSAVANVSFVASSTSGGDITFQRNTNSDASASYSYFPHATGTSTLAPPQNVSITLDMVGNTSGRNAGFGYLGSFTAAGGYGVQVVLHEVGHTLGLGHGGPYNGNVNSATQQYSPFDNRAFTIMSYIDPSDTTAKYYGTNNPLPGTNWGSQNATTWMPGDIDAIQRLYGAQTSGPLNTGQTFGYNTTVTGSLKPYFDFTQNTRPVVTLYDTAAHNTLDLSGSNQDATVNLNPGTYSSTHGMTNNIAIYKTTNIDTAIGGSGNDKFTTSGVANTIDGRGGTNTVVFSGARSEYVVGPFVNNSFTVTKISNQVIDTLSNVQTLTFSDGSVAAPCYVTGTRILTVSGEVAVEDLREGDLVVTASGEHRPITWIGHRSLDCTRHPEPAVVLPVVVRADAFGPGLPLRDLFLSPDHAVRVSVMDEVLIPIKHLINDATIAQVEAAEVTYWHVELDSHDILLAEGLPAESFLDTGVRAAFENAGAFTTLHPDFSPLTLDDFCRPLVQDGPIVDAVRTRLLARAAALGWTLTSEDDLHVVADGVAIYPEREGTTARFSLPAGACAVRLVSKSFVPERVRVGAGDGRRLGVALRGVSVVEASGVVRSLPIAHALFAEGFSFVQGEAGDAWRWTDGDAVLPAALWAGATGAIGLVVETAPEHGTLQAWQAPEPVSAPAAEAEAIAV